REVMTIEDVGDRPTVGDDVSLKAPIVAQMLFEQRGICARWLAIQRVVGAHHGIGFALHDGRAERGQICVFHVMPRSLNVYRVSGSFRAAMYCEMFGRCNSLQILGIVTLQSANKGQSKMRR